MTRNLLVAAMLCACLPQLAFSQSPTVAKKVAKPANVAPAMSVSQRNVEKILLRQTKSQQLKPGVQVASQSSEGYKLMASVSQQGHVNNWYVLDPKGRTVARMNNNSGGTEVDLEGCANKLIQDVANCDQYAYANKYHYGRCLQGAWANWLSCLRGEAVRHTNKNLTPVGGAAVLQKK